MLRRGSFTTIYKHLGSWEAKQASPTAVKVPADAQSDDRIWRLLEDLSGKIEALVTRTGQLEALFSETQKIILALQVSASMSSPLGQCKLVRASIERNVLSRFSMKTVSAKDSAYASSGEYELVFSPAADSSLDEQIQGMCRECKQEANKLNCSAKCEVKS